MEVEYHRKSLERWQSQSLSNTEVRFDRHSALVSNSNTDMSPGWALGNGLKCSCGHHQLIGSCLMNVRPSTRAFSGCSWFDKRVRARRFRGFPTSWCSRSVALSLSCTEN